MAWLTSDDQPAEAKEYLETNEAEVTNHFRVYVTDFEEFKVLISDEVAYIVIILRESCTIIDSGDLNEEVEVALTNWEPFPDEDANITLEDMVSYLIIKKDDASWWGYEWISSPDVAVQTDCEFWLA